jgi:protoheme IX farnesyltransferase
MKFRLSATVVFSSAIGYLLGVDTVVFSDLFLLLVGGILVTGSANGFNQIVERKHDKHMQRTAVRPLPMGNLSVNQALVFTPLKRMSPIAVFVGAFPGAIPILLGWVAATNDFGLAAGILFAVQFCWQFPHFIAISWVLDEQYKKAGFKMIYGGEKGKYPAGIAVMTSILMTIISTLPFFCDFKDLSLSIYALVLLLILGIWFTSKAIKLYQNCDDVTAKQLMLSSFAYLPLMQIIYVLDKFLIQ